MRIAAVILGIIGALAGGALGVAWLTQAGGELGQAALSIASAMGGDGLGGALLDLNRAAYALLGCAIVGLAASVLLAMGKLKGFVAAIVLIAAGALPLVFAGKAVLGLPMALAGALAFFVKAKEASKPAPVAAPAATASNA